MAKERNTETAAENRPVYSVLDYAQSSMNTNTWTHKNQNPFGILLPAPDNLIILFLCGFGAYGEEWSRVVTKARFCFRGLVAIYVIYVCELRGEVKATDSTNLRCPPSQGPLCRECFETLKRCCQG